MNESIHKMTSGVTFRDVSARVINLTNLAKIFAPSSSSRGVDCFLIGATHVLEAIRFAFTLPLLCSVLRYTTAANARSDTSQNS